MNPLLKFGLNRFDDTVDVVIDVRVSETSHLITTGFQMKRPLPVKTNLAIS